MRRNRRFYKGRYWDYYVEQRACYPFDKWVWHWGMVVTMRGRTRYVDIGEGSKRPEPREVFGNLLTDK